MKTSLFLLLSAVCCWPLSELKAQAASDIPLIALGERAVKDILADADNRANTLLRNGEASANRVASNASVEMSILIENLRTGLGKDLNTTFNRLEQDERNVFDQLNVIIYETNLKAALVENIEDNLQIDFSKTLDALPFVKKQPLYITRVRGLYQTFRVLDYPVEVSGKGFGVDAGTRYEIFLSTGLKNNIPIAPEQIGPSPSNKNGILIRIPIALMNDAFLPSGIRRASLYVKAISGEKSLFSSPVEIHANLPIMLIPKVSANLRATAIVNQEGWTAVPDETPFSHPWQGNGRGGSEFLAVDHSYPADWRISSVRLELPDTGCRYCTTDHGEGIAQNVNKTWDNDVNNHVIHLHAACHGDRCALRWYVKFDRQVFTPGPALPEAKDVSFGEQVYFDLAPNAIDWKIDGRFYNHQTFSLAKGVPGKYFLERPSVQIGKRERIVLELKNPF